MQVLPMFAAPWAISPVLSVNNNFHAGPEFHSYGPPSFSVIKTAHKGLECNHSKVSAVLHIADEPGIYPNYNYSLVHTQIIGLIVSLKHHQSVNWGCYSDQG